MFVIRKNICEQCKTRLKIFQINGLCGDVYYGLKCKCREYGTRTDDECNYYSVYAKMVEWRIPTLEDRLNNFTYNILSKIDNMIEILKRRYFKK